MNKNQKQIRKQLSQARRDKSPKLVIDVPHPEYNKGGKMDGTGKGITMQRVIPCGTQARLGRRSKVGGSR